MASGDIIYVGDGVTATTSHEFHGCVNLNRDGTAELPRAELWLAARVVVRGERSGRMKIEAFVHNGVRIAMRPWRGAVVRGSRAER